MTGERATLPPEVVAAVLGTVRNVIVVADAAGSIAWVNDAFTKASGYAPEEAIGRSMAIMKSGSQDEEFYRAMWQSIRAGNPWKGRLTERHKYGAIYDVEQTVQPVRDASGDLKYFVVVQHSTDAEYQNRSKIDILAGYDRLTGLSNRYRFHKELQRVVADLSESNDEFALVFLDLTGLSKVNDTFGHEYGDRILKLAAERIIARVPQGSIVSRVGGDEFAIIMPPHNDMNHTLAAIRDIIKIISTYGATGSDDITIGMSVGISLYPKDAIDAESLERFADIALQKARRLSSNAYLFFTADMSVETEERITLERDLRRALSSQEFALFIQPQIDIRTRKIIGGETLIRWFHPQRGMIPPLKFIGIAEETGLIVRIGEWCLREALRHWRKLDSIGITLPTISVNLSAAQFQAGNILETAIKALGYEGVPAERLELEITESVLMHDSYSAVDMLKRLSKLHIQLAIDDFGTGYSSLNYLRQFPVNRLKIDKSFVDELLNDGHTEITKAIISLGHSLNMNILAEGVEHETQMTVLEDCGCDSVQGYLIAKPMGFDQFVEFARTYNKQFV
ncbi:hypothetical protein FACS1894186_6880 [Alphaproteobacteria bacterium]|nr:hypothetical protein FACS1894186_6880 [Alphaproteobacteria bacterium]